MESKTTGPEPARFDDDIWPESDAGDGTGMVRGTQSADEVRLEAGINPVKNVNIESAPLSDQCCKQADWTGRDGAQIER
jgi:hypothetical protein